MQRPKIVCLCGSTRFHEVFEHENLLLTLQGVIVLSIGANMKDSLLFAELTEQERNDLKRKLDELHKRKIDLCDEVLVLNVGDYIGESTRDEIDYARAHGKKVRFLEPHDMRPIGWTTEL